MMKIVKKSKFFGICQKPIRKGVMLFVCLIILNQQKSTGECEKTFIKRKSSDFKKTQRTELI